MEYGRAKIAVARSCGDSADEGSLAIAGEAILSAIRDWNAEHNWEFKLTEDPNFALADGSQDIVIPGLKKVHTLRMLTPDKRNMTFQRLRTIDYTLRDQDTAGSPVIYTVIEGITSITIRVIPPVDGESTFYIRYYAEISEPSEDTDEIDVPKRFLNALLSRAKYHYMIDQDTENMRLDKYEAFSTDALRRAVRDDKKQPDENEQMISRAEYGWARGQSDEELFDF